MGFNTYLNEETESFTKSNRATKSINGLPERRSMMINKIILKIEYEKENYKLHDRNKYILKQKT